MLATDKSFWIAAAQSVVLLAATTWLGLVAVLAFFQRDLLYMPPQQEITPAAAGLTGFTTRTLTAPDGTRVAVWSSPAPEGAPTLLFFHGNGGSHGVLAGKYKQLRDAGYGVFAPTYRGHPGSTGRPSEASNVADAVMTYDALVAGGTPPERIVLYGESLGSGIAIQLATRRPVGAIVLESPYSSITDIAAYQYWFVPVKLLLLDRYDSVAHASNVTAPVLILHGVQDDLIPIQLARRLYEAIPNLKRFVSYPSGGHVGLLGLGGLDEVHAFLRHVVK
jgi:pimeloyl-ACP methyl ester carboxylesterase